METIKKSSEWREQWEYYNTGSHWFYVADGLYGFKKISYQTFEGSQYPISNGEEEFNIPLSRMIEKMEELRINGKTQTVIIKQLTSWRNEYKKTQLIKEREKMVSE